MAACSNYEGLIAASVYDALDASEKDRLATHLHACAACSQELDELTRTAGLVASEPFEIGVARRDEVLRGIARRIDPQVITTRNRKPLAAKRSWALPILAAASALFAFVGLLILAQRSPRPEETAQEPITKRVEPAPQPVPVAPKKPELAPAPQPIKPAPAPVIEPAPVKPAPTPTPEPTKTPEPTPVVPEPEKTPAPTPAKPRVTLAVMAHLDQVHGDVTVVTEGTRSAAKTGMELRPGQEIQTGPKSSFAAIKVTDGSRVELSSASALEIVGDLSVETGRTLRVTRGLASAQVAKQPAARPMIFRTPNAEAKVLGTQLLLDVTADATRLEVREGRVRLTRSEDGAGVDVPAGSFAVAAKGPAPAAKLNRLSTGLQALYSFREARGGIVHDLSGTGVPLDLKIISGRAVTWTPDALSLHGATRIDSETPATKIVDACRKSNELTLEAWIKPAKAVVDFDGCILSLSTDVPDRNFALVQGDLIGRDVYAATLRLSETDAKGGAHLLSPKGTPETRLTHLAFSRTSAGIEKLYVNGIERASRARSGTFASWNDTFRLILGNESTEERPWAGEFRLVAVYSRALAPIEVVRNFKAGAE